MQKANGREVLSYFLRLGLLGFGGPLAMIASMQKDLIESRGWMSPERFARAFALIKAMPGPLAFMCAVFIGRARAGWRGGFAAAFGLIFPAFLLMMLFAVFYQTWRELPNANHFMLGMQAGALGIVLMSLRSLGMPYYKRIQFWILTVIAFAVTLQVPAAEPILIIASGAATAIGTNLKRHRLPAFAPLFNWHSFMFGDFSSAALATHGFLGTTGELLWACFKAGAFVFGSGLAIVPMMENDFVTRLHWLTHQEFMDALAFGQITPGPVVITSAFIGFKAIGFWGALLATLAIFAASFFHMMTWFPSFVDRLSRVSWIKSFLLGAIAAVIGAIAATVFRLSLDWSGQPFAYVLMVAVLLAALFTKLPAWSLIPLSGVAGLAMVS